MARRGKHTPLLVFLNGKLVGRLNKKASGAIDFRYDPSWLDWQFSMPVSLSLPLREAPHIGAPVVAVFENLLPDSAPIRNRIAERVHAEGTDAYSLLAAVGRDCVGALQFLPEGQEAGPAGAVDGEKLTIQEIGQILGNLASAPLGLDEDADFRISIAGAQEKTAFLRWKDKWYRPTGTTATTHIFKPQIGRLPNGIDLSFSVENEYLCLQILAAFEIPVANVAMGSFGEKRALIVERFDRHWGRDGRLLRLPQEDFCQALSVPPSIKYQDKGGPSILDILGLLKGSDRSEQDRETFFKSQVLFWLLGATDGHAKNFSIHLGQGGRFRMTPLYDVISAQPSVDSGQIRQNKMKLAMSVGEKNRYQINRILPRHFLQTAAKAGMGDSVVKPVFEHIQDTGKKLIEKTRSSLPSDFPETIAASIETGFLQRMTDLKKFT